MSNLTRHLPQVGVLVLSAALAAGAYSVYAGQTGRSSHSRGEPAAELTLQSPGDAGPTGKSRERDRGHERRRETRELAGLLPASAPPVGPTSPAPALGPAPTGVATKPPSETGRRPPHGGGVRDPDTRDRELIDEEHLGDDELDRELQDIGSGAPPTSLGGPQTGSPPSATPEPAPSEPLEPAPTDPADPEPDDPADPTAPAPDDEPVDPTAPAPDDEPVDEPADPGTAPPAADPGAPSPTDPGATPPTTQPDPSAAPDPDAGLDDTPVGTLDQADLGTPIDEAPATGTGAAPAAAQAP